MLVSIRRLTLYPLCAVRSCRSAADPPTSGLRLLSPSFRTLFSETGVWEKDYRSETRQRVEEWWHPRIMEQWRKDALEEVRGGFTLSSMPAHLLWHGDVMINSVCHCLNCYLVFGTNG